MIDRKLISAIISPVTVHKGENKEKQINECVGMPETEPITMWQVCK